MRDKIFIPDFRTIEEAIMFAATHKPFKTAHEEFQNRDAYLKYGESARRIAIKCWEASNKPDLKEMARQSRLLSYALPAFVFDYERRG